MSSYAWTDSDKTVLVRMDEGSHSYIPASPENPDYVAFLASGKAAAEYTPPPPADPPAPLTPTEKLAALGLTTDDLRALLSEQPAA